MEKRVREIPATRNRFTSVPVFSQAKKKVAGYARVSTDLEEQQSSYENQVEYYTAFIKSNPEWEFAGMYTDEGITATNTAHRNGFNTMIADALAGKIDLIITKSVSRFARNTVDSLTTVRKLKEKGIEIYFEKENIWTLDSKGELLITIMSSLAQEESRSISENTTWGKRKAFQDGKVSVNWTRFLGYDKDFKINEEEAKTVRYIFKLYLKGFSLYQIAKELKKCGMKTASGLDYWHTSTIKRVLSNEKYKGDALLQKEYTTDFLTKKRKKNTGELKQYYVEKHHEPIIDPKVFDLVQAKLKDREQEGQRKNGYSVFASKIKCGDCGHWYGPNVWYSTHNRKKRVFLCNHKYSGDKICTTPTLIEAEIKEYFLRALQKLVKGKDEVIANIRKLQKKACSTETLKKEQVSLQNELQELEIQLRRLISDNAHSAQAQSDYQEKYKKLHEPYCEKLKQQETLASTISEREQRNKRLEAFLDAFETIENCQDSFDEDLWGSLVDYMTVYDKNNVVVTFIGGVDIKA